MQDIYFGVYRQGNSYMKNTVYPIVESTVTEAMTEAGDSNESAMLQTTTASIQQTETPHSGSETSLFPWLIGAAVLLAIVIAAVLHFTGKPKQGSTSVSASGGSGTKVFGKSASPGIKPEPLDEDDATVTRTRVNAADLKDPTITSARPHQELAAFGSGTKVVSGKKQDQPPAPEETWRKYFTLDEDPK